MCNSFSEQKNPKKKSHMLPWSVISVLNCKANCYYKNTLSYLFTTIAFSNIPIIICCYVTFGAIKKIFAVVIESVLKFRAKEIWHHCNRAVSVIIY